MSSPLLTIKNLTLQLPIDSGWQTVISGLNLQINHGETYALLGESGCGKSMTAYAITQLLPDNVKINQESEINFLQNDLLTFSELSMRKIRGKKIAMIFQDPMTSLNPVMTIGEQIFEALNQFSNISKKKYHNRVLELLDAVGITDAQQKINQYPHQLSGGMKQRVMIAIALACEPDLLIADEPTTALDVTIQQQVLSLLKKLQQRFNMAMLFITHDLAVVKQMADVVGVMYAGHIVEQARCDEFFENPKHPYSQKLFAALPDIHKREKSLEIIPGIVPKIDEVKSGCRFASRCTFSAKICESTTPDLLNYSDEHLLRCHLYDKNYQSYFSIVNENKNSPDEKLTKPFSYPTDILEVKNLKVYFPIEKGLFKRTVGYVKAVDGVSFSIKAGRTLALVGESGCGKTTTAKAILKLLSASCGEINYQGQNLLELSERQMRLVRRDIQFIFQDPLSAMNPRMLVRDILLEGISLREDKISKPQQIALLAELLSQVGLSQDSLSKYPHEFSGGQRQRLCIARALAVKPKLIVCDEPTSALDVSVQAQILNLLRDLQRNFGLSYLFITHNLSVVSYLADEVAVMYSGRLVEFGRTEEILTAAKHPYTQSLLASAPSIETDSVK